MISNSLGHLYKDGEIIFKQGSVGDNFYVIQEGKVEVVHETDDKQSVLAVITSPDFFGEMGLFEKTVRSCTIRAKGDAKILTMDKKTLYKKIQQDPSIAFRLLEKMSNRLREANRLLSEKNKTTCS